MSSLLPDGIPVTQRVPVPPHLKKAGDRLVDAFQRIFANHYTITDYLDLPLELIREQLIPAGDTADQRRRCGRWGIIASRNPSPFAQAVLATRPKFAALGRRLRKCLVLADKIAPADPGEAVFAALVRAVSRAPWLLQNPTISGTYQHDQGLLHTVTYSFLRPDGRWLAGLSDGPAWASIICWTEAQRRILDLLHGKALKAVTLAKQLGTAHVRQIHRSGWLKELLAAKLVANDRQIGGYYRPDAPPPGAGCLPNYQTLGTAAAGDLAQA